MIIIILMLPPDRVNFKKGYGPRSYLPVADKIPPARVLAAQQSAGLRRAQLQLPDANSNHGCQVLILGAERA